MHFIEKKYIMHIHDIFNVLFFSLIILLSIIRLTINSDLSLWIQLSVQLYMIFDAIYIYMYYNNGILKYTLILHHLLAIILICVPLYWKELDLYFYPQVMVEINAIFLILKRYTDNKLIHKLFHMTWIWIRFVLNLIILMHYIYMSSTYKLIKYIVPTICQTALIFINCIWHYGLYIKKK